MPSDHPDRRARPAARAGFLRDEGGAILVFWAIFLAVAFGFAALSFDLGRTANTQSELQSFADQVALAAVGELDGRPGARDRAREAADDLISRVQTFGEGEQLLSGDENFTLTLLRTADGAVANTDFEARFARVDVNLTTVLTPFASVTAALLGRAGENLSSDVGAVAVAGRGTYACDITPLFFCLPDANWRAGNNAGRQVDMVAGSSGNAAWGPGNFGFLDPASLGVDPSGPCAGENGANLYRCLVAANRGITTCIATDSAIDTRPGQAVGLTAAFNVRFDIYSGATNSFRNDSRYTPAPNVIGTVWDGAATTANPTLDSCIAAGTCRFGAGDWNRELYLSTYHNGLWPIRDDPRPAEQIPLRENATRYDVYLAEIASARARGDAGMPTASGFATGLGRPQNHRDANTAAERAALDPARLTFVAAAVDCGNQSMNGRTGVFPVEYVRMFFTQPVVGAGQDARIRAEIIGTAGGLGVGAGEASFREIFQLVR